MYPTGGKPGEEVEVTWLGDASGKQTTKVRLPETEGEFLYYPGGRQRHCSFAEPFVCLRFAGRGGGGANNNRNEATPMEGPGVASGVIEEEGG